jgi:hypothetical protein
MPEKPAPVLFQIFSGENLMSRFAVALDAGLTWKGRYDPTALYVVDDALLGEDNIGYKVIADVGPTCAAECRLYTTSIRAGLAASRR